MWHKELPTYRESDMVCIEFNNGNPGMLVEGTDSAIGVGGGVTGGVTNVL